jgi:uncharacterized protein YacL
MLIEAIRLVITIGFLAGSYRLADANPTLLGRPDRSLLLTTILGAAIGYIVGGVVARAVDSTMQHAETRLARRHASEVLAATVGLLIGLVLGALVSWPILFTVEETSIAYPAAAFVVLIVASFTTRFAIRKRLELFGVLGVSPGSQAQGTGSLLDTSAAIDGRVIALWRAGLLPQPMWVPSFILWELQGIADSGDPLRRRRGQRGLDVLASLREAGAEVRVIDEDPAGTTDPDAKLVVIARRRNLPLVTSDTNLAKAAELQGLQVLNLHALTELLRPPVLPGEILNVQLIKIGREPGQAVGYLDDGSMVVVESAAHALGATLEVEVTSVLQNPNGRMLFARVPGTGATGSALEAT